MPPVINILNGIYLNTCTVFFNKKFFGARKGHFFQKNVGFSKRKTMQIYWNKLEKMGKSGKKCEKVGKGEKRCKRSEACLFFCICSNLFFNLLRGKKGRMCGVGLRPHHVPYSHRGCSTEPSCSARQRDGKRQKKAPAFKSLLHGRGTRAD